MHEQKITKKIIKIKNHSSKNKTVMMTKSLKKLNTIS